MHFRCELGCSLTGGCPGLILQPQPKQHSLRNVSRHVVDRIERNAPPPQLESPPALATTRHPEGLSANPNSEYTCTTRLRRALDPYGRCSPAQNSIDKTFSISGLPDATRLAGYAAQQIAKIGTQARPPDTHAAAVMHVYSLSRRRTNSETSTVSGNSGAA
jgi:hypothetical protein